MRGALSLTLKDSKFFYRDISDIRRTVVIYIGKNVHFVLVNCLGGLPWKKSGLIGY